MVDGNGETALMKSLRAVVLKFDHVKALLDAGADVNMKNDKGETALMIATNRLPELKNELSEDDLRETIQLLKEKTK
jgi:ankyrin repeat protein